ncbi:MAG: PSD1 domain-containing protein, partial [Planctomycetales bacterium]|nr:PSD1 domain-containing protein [Planctomycetales bacterium]
MNDPSTARRLTLTAILLAVVGAGPLRGEPIDFGREVLPLLADRCFACHGPDEGTRETDMRLDTQEGLYGELDSGDVTVRPGNSDQSALYSRLVTDDEDLRMPPADSGKEVSAEEIALIKQWIDEGASWQKHWSLIAPSRPQRPSVSNESWPRNDIDWFVMARLDQEGLRPSPAADKITLIRRVTYDLTGLPPTPQEIDDFLADTSEEAYERVVNRLLESVHYGEHMARYWLDAARYADTHGLHLDNYRQMWPYRDWVIKAFNANMPFDQFTVEQLAGDLLPNPTLDQQIATGFNRCNVTTSEGGVIPEEYYVHYTNDRVATMSTVWMGVSMGCVTCHEHKFDPYSMRDFYQLFAFFNSLDGPVMDGNRQDTEPVVKVTTSAQRAELDKLDRRVSVLSQVMEAPIREVDDAQAQWEAQIQSSLSDDSHWQILHPETFKSEGGAAHSNLEDESILVSGENPAQEVYEITALTKQVNMRAIRLEGLTHESLGGAAGRSPNGNVVLSEVELEIAPAADPDKWQKIALTHAWADHEQTDGDFKIANAIDGKTETGWAIGGHQRREDRTAIILAETAFGHTEGTRLRVRLRHESVYPQHQFGRIRLAVSSQSGIPHMDDPFAPAEIVKLVAIPAEQRDAQANKQIRAHFRNNISQDETLRVTREQLAELRKQKEELDASLPTTLVWKEKAQPDPAYVLIRGAYDKKGDEVTRNTPAALPPLAMEAGQTPTRLDLSHWLLSADHPLTARVTVNRFWQQYFGRGIVESTEDFGSQGKRPTHPQLLDWLAVEFRENSWDVKELQKLIVMSATYQQASKVDPDAAQKDPSNALLSRGPRFRLDAELIRDTALATSGLLVRKIGGPSVKPYQPPGIWHAVGYTDSNTANFTRDSGEALYRRSLYTFWKRTAPPPALVTLDAPSRENCTVRRSRTNTPLAALALMNDEQFVEASRAMAARAMQEGGAGDGQRAA